MPKPFKPTRPFALPPNAEIVELEGRPHVRLKERGRTVLYPLTRCGRKYLRPAKCWYFDYRDENGTVRRVKGFADLKATEQLAAEYECKVARRRVGIIDPAEEHARRPLADHLADYAAHLEAKGNTPKHIRDTLARCSTLFKGCGFVFPLDADAGTVSAWLVNQRRDGTPVELPDEESFRPAEAARLLGITKSALNRALLRHQLAAVGNGKARRLPRATVEALALNQAKGASPETVNHYVRAERGFFRWLVQSKRIGANPLETLSLVNTATDVRRRRRELTADELRLLLAATRASRRTFRGLTAEDRYFLYLVAASTGFRAKALANLTPGDFNVTSPSPAVTLPARFDKSRRGKVQPLPSDVAAALRDYLNAKPTSSPIWGGTWHSGAAGAEMLRRDLESAGIPYAVEGPDGPEYADFHALRHTYLTMLGRHGVDLRTAQELAGHSTPLLTARYSHRRLYDLAGAVEKLPPLVPPAEQDTSAAEIPLRLTGTDGARVDKESAKADNAIRLGVPPGVPAGYAGSQRFAQICTIGMIDRTSEQLTQPLEMTGAGADWHRPASVGFELPGQDSNLNKENQNLLCYRYTTG